MSDSIDREKALVLVKDVCDAILSCCDSHYDEGTGDEVYSDIREVDAILKCNKEIRIAIKNMPSAQPEIIRCKDCKKWHTNCLAVGGKHGCDVLSDYTKPDDYCSWAERRTDGV